ncbi:VanZ family protein [Sporolactobacillus pectinivorans]|uniref:VanZ family protein n=1 Tax=Sporolactobacillus pectinivorans TaxID=1591408 RepID=UPI000C257900|nr:VanZ family protein [Sporolactobacillus pectinivorans]
MLKITKKRPLFIVLFVCYLTTLLILTLFTHNYYTYGQSVNLEIFSSIQLMLKSREPELILKNVLGNVILFIPMGVLFPLLFFKVRFFLLTLLLGFVLSLFIETAQYLFAARIFDIDDILLNVTGALIGHVLFSMVRFFKNKVFIFFSK